jgi:hypothetical protein
MNRKSLMGQVDFYLVKKENEVNAVINGCHSLAEYFELQVPYVHYL